MSENQLNQLKGVAQEYERVYGRDSLTAMLHSFKAKHLSDLQPEEYLSLYVKMVDALRPSLLQSISDSKIPPVDIHAVADSFKAFMSKEMSGEELAQACTIVDCFAATLVRLTLCETHLGRIANALEEQASVMKSQG